jgi:hypothetical protein
VKVIPWMSCVSGNEGNAATLSACSYRRAHAVGS